ncbi:hypothetical protein B296_00029707 [Ensete ventricosum]|uniref:Uncharacterized protein n=1 Tax=Ensete ventricosum TaxID=4639 RepID=A0A426ZAT3_ENSVE|nr:hypothetical protein B296_00029707 [Ensete ventricosum]
MYIRRTAWNWRRHGVGSEKGGRWCLLFTVENMRRSLELDDDDYYCFSLFAAARERERMWTKWWSSDWVIGGGDVTIDGERWGRELWLGLWATMHEMRSGVRHLVDK